MKRSGLIILGILIFAAVGLFLVLKSPPASKPLPDTTVVATSPQPSQTQSIITGTETPAITLLPDTAITVKVPPPDEAASRLSVPQGFTIRIFADNIQGTPRFMTLGPDRQIYVSLFASGEIARLPDMNEDGLADGIEIVASGLNLPHGLEWHDGWLYVAELGRVERFKDSNGDGKLETSEVVTENIPGSGGHISRTLHFGPGGKLYVSAGSSCNVCLESDPRRAAILRFNPDGSIPADNPFANDPDERKRPLWAWGLRNSVDFLWTPSGTLWADHNGRDNLLDNQGSSDSLPPEEIIIPVQKGMSHGWPYCYTAISGINLPPQPEAPDTQNGLQLPAGFDCSTKNVVPALFTDLAHSAPLGMTLGNAQLAFPASYQDSLYVAYHGSWNTSLGGIRDCKVERILLNGETPTGNETFVNGWRAEGQTCGSAKTWGRTRRCDHWGGWGIIYL